MAMLVLQGRQVELDGPCVIGRQRDCGLVLADRAASRQHARIAPVDGGWQIEDLGSANGTLVNGERLTAPRRLRNGDAIRIGEVEILFACREAESAPAAAARLDPQSLAGHRIAGFRIERLVARTGMGCLYRAEQESMQRPAAFKVFARAWGDDDAFAARFRAALSRAASFAHERFARILDSGVSDGLAWYATEWVEGDTLAELLAREGRFAPEVGLLVAERLAQALADAHAAGLVHGSLSLRSVMLERTGKIRIFDLGLAALLQPGRDRARPEHAWYLAPDAGGEPSPADDAYALGCLLYHLLTGQPPFGGRSAEELRRAHAAPSFPSLRSALPRLGDSADELLAALLAKRRAERLADLGEAARRLRALRQRLSSAEAAERHAERLARRAATARQAREDHLVKQVAIAGAAVLAVGILGFVVIPPLLRGTAVGGGQPLPSAEDRPSPPTPSSSATAVAASSLTTLASGGQSLTPAPAASADPLAAAIQALRRRLAAGPEDGWPALERELADLAARAGGRADLASELQRAREQLRLAAAAWYRAELGRLPPPGPEGVAARLAAFLRLRDEAGAEERRDAEERYQQELALLVQQLHEARRAARRALEGGRFAELDAIAERLAPAVAGTPFAGLHAQFAALCREAAGVAAFWQRDWRTTALTFEQQRGEQALAAGAALLLAGELPRARRILLGDPALNRGELLLRREAILGGLAAALTFDDPADLQQLEIERGEPRLAGGALQGRAEEAAAILCAVPIGGPDWLAELHLTLADSEGEAVLSCVAGGRPVLLLRLADERATLRRGDHEQHQPLPTAGEHRVRLGARGGLFVAAVDGREVARLEPSPVPPDARLRLELSGSAWRLEALQVAGGR